MPTSAAILIARNGPFFAAAETFKDTLGRTLGKPKVLILRLRNMLKKR